MRDGLPQLHRIRHFRRPVIQSDFDGIATRSCARCRGGLPVELVTVGDQPETAVAGRAVRKTVERLTDTA